MGRREENPSWADKVGGVSPNQRGHLGGPEDLVSGTEASGTGCAQGTAGPFTLLVWWNQTAQGPRVLSNFFTFNYPISQMGKVRRSELQ